ncbi:hypothetical protein IIA29_03215 [candidate division KSB1 bacterium]|nr:hypothetical protein [candidate division KSB1 bacterium]
MADHQAEGIRARERAIRELCLLADLPDLWDITVRSWEMDMSSSRFFDEAPQEEEDWGE